MSVNLIKWETSAQAQAALQRMAKRAMAEKAQEDKIRAKVRAELAEEFPVPQSGYTHCACRDCMDTTMSSDIARPELCTECADAECEIFPRGFDNSSVVWECQRDDAYGDDQCEGCGWETRNCACGA